MLNKPFTPPQAPLHAATHSPKPPRHAVPGSKSAGDKARHVGLSTLSTGGLLIVLWLHNNGAPHELLILCLPLTLGGLWPFVTLLQDVLIALYLRHAYDHYIYETAENGRITRATALAHSHRYHGVQNTKQEITLNNPAQVDRLYSQNSELVHLLERALVPVEDTQPLDGITDDMQRLLAVARKHGRASARYAAMEGLSGPRYVIARDSLVQAGLLVPAGQSYELARLEAA